MQINNEYTEMDGKIDVAASGNKRSGVISKLKGKQELVGTVVQRKGGGAGRIGPWLSLGCFFPRHWDCMGFISVATHKSRKNTLWGRVKWSDRLTCTSIQQ
jgi:hypothetical protein